MREKRLKEDQNFKETERKRISELRKKKHEDTFSTFCNLRPSNVLLLKDMPSDQCKCKIHENFIYLLKGIHVKYDGNFWEKILCDH